MLNLGTNKNTVSSILAGGGMKMGTALMQSSNCKLYGHHDANIAKELQSSWQ